MLWLLMALAGAGENVQDSEITHRWTGGPGGMVLHQGFWTLGRGHCPGQAPSLTTAPDGWPCTYHRPSPALPWPAFESHLEQAQGRTPAAWVQACSVGAEFCAWLAAVPSDAREAMHEQARYSTR